MENQIEYRVFLSNCHTARTTESKACNSLWLLETSYTSCPLQGCLILYIQHSIVLGSHFHGFRLYLPNEERIYTAIRRHLILPSHTACPLLIPLFLHVGVCHQGAGLGAGGWRVPLHLSRHSTGLEGAGSLSYPNLAQGDEDVPRISFNGVSNQENGIERNAMKRKQVLPSQAGWWVNKLCL